MTAQNMLAVIMLLALINVLYAIRDGHARYLPDLLALALALLADRQWLALGAAGLVITVRHSPLAAGLAADIPRWLHPILLPGACDMSRPAPALAGDLPAPEIALSEVENTEESGEISQPVAENAQELISFGETAAIARLIVAGTIGLTEGVKIGAGAKSGTKYQRRSRQIQAEVDRIRNHYPPNSNLKRFE